MTERRAELFEEVRSRVDLARPGRFAVNLRPSYMYFHDRERTFLDLYVSLQRGDLLTVECATVQGHPETFWDLRPHLDAIERRAALPEPFDVREPGSPGRQGPLRKGVIAVHRPRPDLQIDTGMSEAAIWSADRVIALHDAIEPYWSTTRTARQPSRRRSNDASAGDAPVRLGLPRPFRPMTDPEPVGRLVDGESTRQGLKDHEDTVAVLDGLVCGAGLEPLYGGDPSSTSAGGPEDGSSWSR